ncbi:GIY-YIG nuclease family protein [Streptomyces sp. NPDC005732]|uniref:GIY-YIG nuclease family protein n=1 Tax=Streptomyces sp. NPDC005732 TaxID=3157057 RepID=UPI0033E6AB7F
MTHPEEAPNPEDDDRLYHCACPPFPTPGPGNSVVYVIGRQQSSIAKIGVTGGDLRKRLKGIQTGSPVKLEVLWWFFASAEDEQRLHDEFDYCRLEGEWFDFKGEEPDQVVRACAMNLWPERFPDR